MNFFRADWHAAPPTEPPALAEPADSLVVHHSAGPAAETVDEAFDLLRAIQAQHQASGYIDIAYSVAVDNAGNLYEARGLQFLPAATYGANSHTRAIVWLGNSESEPVADAALRAIAALYRTEIGRNLQPGATITGHRDWTATACPGAGLYAALDTIRRYAGDQPQPTEEPDMALWVHEPKPRATLFQNRPVLDLWLPADGSRLGKLTVGSALVIMPADPAQAADPARPLRVQVHQATPDGRYHVEDVVVAPGCTTFPIRLGGRVGVVFDRDRPVTVYGRETHFEVAA